MPNKPTLQAPLIPGTPVGHGILRSPASHALVEGHHKTAFQAKTRVNMWISAAYRRSVFSGDYTKTVFKNDFMAGLIVALVTLPLSMALGIATGVAPQNGLYTVMTSGLLASVLGGSRCQITGPTAAFVAILSPIVTAHGLQGLLAAAFVSGFIELAMGLTGMGKLIVYMPDTVKYGFTAGIALTIASQQLKDFFGATYPHRVDHFLDIIAMFAENISTVHLVETIVASSTLTLLVMVPRFTTAIPAPIIAVFSMTLIMTLLSSSGIVTVNTINSRFSYIVKPEDPISGSSAVMGHGIPSSPPLFSIDFLTSLSQPGAMGVGELLSAGFKISLLGAIESLLSALIADDLSKTRHDPDCELIALGVGNIVGPFFGGIPATGAIARTATNIKFGAKTPVSSTTAAVFTFLSVVFLSPLLGYIPMACLAALLVFVAYRMAEVDHLVKIIRSSPVDDRIVLLTCFALTVIFDMTVGVGVGLIAQALMFAKTMNAATEQFVIDYNELSAESGHKISVFELVGPIFFGSAYKIVNLIENVHEERNEAVVLVMDNVPVCDVSGAIALTQCLEGLISKGCKVFIVGLRVQPHSVLRRTGIPKKGLYTMDSLSQLHRAISHSKDIPKTPVVTWINQGKFDNLPLVRTPSIIKDI